MVELAVVVVVVATVMMLTTTVAAAFVPTGGTARHVSRPPRVVALARITHPHSVLADSWLSFPSKLASRLHLAAVDEESSNEDSSTTGSTGQSDEESDAANDETSVDEAVLRDAAVNENDDSNSENEAEEDPELTALKEAIATAEMALKAARRQRADVGDRADDFTATGYARKVAEMENMRRARSVRTCGRRVCPERKRNKMNE